MHPMQHEVPEFRPTLSTLWRSGNGEIWSQESSDCGRLRPNRSYSCLSGDNNHASMKYVRGRVFPPFLRTTHKYVIDADASSSV